MTGQALIQEVEKKERIEARFLASTKRLAERAAQLNGTTLTDYLSKLVLDDAPGVLKRHNEIKLTNAQYDNFIKVCSSNKKLSSEIKEAAKLLDSEGF